jgi:hypothetical protein
MLRNPAGPGGGEVEISDPRAPGAQWPPEVELSGDAPPPDEVPTGEQEATDSLRQMMAGILMAALGDEDDPDGADDGPSAAQQRVADLFALPYDYPRSAAPADLVPRQARVLMVFDNPDRLRSRMALVRMPGNIDVALEAFYKHYEAIGWKGEDLRRPGPEAYGESQPDRGWLVVFRQGRRERIVYARPRTGGEETLVAVYDPHYEAD